MNPLATITTTTLFLAVSLAAPGLAESTAGTSDRADAADTKALQTQVTEAEKAFAKSMADRDFEAFQSFLADEAVFLSGGTERRGKEAVSAHWQKFFTADDAPFSWAPATVSVLDSGQLALSTGPVHTSDGKRTATYTSIWRQVEPGVWRIIFDKGDRYCE